MRFLRALMADRQGATAIEYALLAGLISLVVINAAGTMGNALSSTFVAVANDMSNASDGSL
jgi:pilus assembly protein Flp/PilA